MIQSCKYLVGLTVIPIKNCSFLYILTLPIIERSYVIAIAREFEKCNLQPQSSVHNYNTHASFLRTNVINYRRYILLHITSRVHNDVILYCGGMKMSQHLVLLIAYTCNKI